MKKQILAIFLLFFTLHLSAAQFSQQKLDQITAPIALYPDALLSQVLMAATYPQQIKEAVLWSQSNGYPKGETALRAAEYKNWDPSVISLTAFPQVLRMMGQRPVWTQNLGDAFLENPDYVMRTIQRLRIRAKHAGHLRSSSQQTVSIRYDDGVETIAIEPASQNILYVPVYDSRYVYGTWPYPALMPFVYYPSHYRAKAGVYFGFRSGIALHAMMLWSNVRWNHHDIAINVSRYNSAYKHRQIHSTRASVSWRDTIRPHHTRHVQKVRLQHQKEQILHQRNVQKQREIKRKQDLRYQKELQRKRDLRYQKNLQYQHNLQKQRKIQREQTLHQRNVQKQREIERRRTLQRQRDIRQRKDLQRRKTVEYQQHNSQQKRQKSSSSRGKDGSYNKNQDSTRHNKERHDYR